MEILDLGEALGGVYCNFYFPNPISSDLLVQLEETLRRFLSENKEISLLEMVPFSASELLKKIGQPARAQQVLEKEGLVQIVRIGSFADWSDEELLAYPKEIGLIRLLDLKVLKKGFYRVFGVCAPTKEKLKEYMRRREAFAEKNHEVVGEKLGLWRCCEGKRVWLCRGLELRRACMDFLRDRLSPFFLEIEGDFPLAREALGDRSGSDLMQFTYRKEPVEAERGLLDAPEVALVVKSFQSSGDKLISCLQTIAEAITILGFRYRILRFGKRRDCDPMVSAFRLGMSCDPEWEEGDPGLELLVEDALGCEWPVLSVSELPRGKGFCAVFEVERKLALLLEKNGSSLPFWLQPEQLRVFPSDLSLGKDALNEASFFRRRGFRVGCEMPRGDESLADRLKRAHREGVPFIAIVGEGGREAGLISWRRDGSPSKETGGRGQLLMLLREAAGDKD